MTYGANQGWRDRYQALLDEFFEIMKKEVKSQSPFGSWFKGGSTLLEITCDEYELLPESEKAFQALKQFVEENRTQHKNPLI